MPGNRYGYAGHLKGLEGFGGFEVNFLPYYKALHEEGYNILTYDIRNHGQSGQGTGGIVSIGLFEYRDVLASLQYVNSRPDTKNMVKGMMNICLGADSALVAMDKKPEYFKDIKATIALQPISIRPFIEKALENLNINVKEGAKYFDESIRNVSGFYLDELSPLEYAKSVRIPTMVVQVHNDFRTRASDVESIFDNIQTKEKKLHWIEGTNERFQGYNYFSKHPQLMLEWFNKYLQ